MLDKCAGPSCSATFRNIANGRLFRLEPDPSSREVSMYFKEEYFWLCAKCCKRFKLHLDVDGCVIVVPLPDRTHAEHPHSFATISRNAGKMLRSVTVFSELAGSADGFLKPR